MHSHQKMSNPREIEMTHEAQPAIAVTGASTGIGKTIALALDADGLHRQEAFS